MSVNTDTISFLSMLLILLFCVNSSKSIQFSGNEKQMEETIEKYFPYENNLLVVLTESAKESFLPTFHVPVVVVSQDQVLQDCRKELLDQDGYVLITSSAHNSDDLEDRLEDRIVPLLKCFNQTTFHLKTKYILVFDFFKGNDSHSYEAYSSFFHKLWTVFGIINIAIFPVQDDSLNNGSPLILTYNPFLARHQPIALTRNSLTDDIRAVMIHRFRNMYGHSIRTAYYIFHRYYLQDITEKQFLGGDTSKLFIQAVEEKLNFSFVLYESSFGSVFGVGQDLKADGGEFKSGKAEFCINLSLSPPEVQMLNKIQPIRSDLSMDVVVIVPKPRQIESWKYFLYIFQWKVCVALVVVLFLLSCAAFVFQSINTRSKMSNYKSSATSEIVSVWLAALSASVNNLPTTHSQRLLITWSLLLGLIFVPLICAQLFDLMTSKPSLAPIRTLEDLRDSNLPVYAIEEHLPVFLNNFENTSLQRIKDNFRTDEMYENIVYLDPKYLNITDHAMLYVNDMIEVATAQPENKDFLQYFDIVKEPIAQTYISVKIAFGSVFYDHFYDLSHRLMSGGIFRKWMEAYKYREAKRSADYFKPTVSEESHQPVHSNTALTYEDLKMAFYTLYIGLTLSSLCFLKELFKL